MPRIAEPLARRFFEALRLEIHDKPTHTARYRVTLTGKTLPEATHAAHEAITVSTTALNDQPAEPNGGPPDAFPPVWCPRQGSQQMGTDATSRNIVGAVTVERSVAVK